MSDLKSGIKSKDLCAFSECTTSEKNDSENLNDFVNYKVHLSVMS